MMYDGLDDLQFCPDPYRRALDLIKDLSSADVTATTCEGNDRVAQALLKEIIAVAQGALATDQAIKQGVLR